MAATKSKFIPSAPTAIFLFVVYCLVWFFLPPSYNEHSYLASIIDKHAALDRAKSPKIVFVGGSNLALGLNSERLHAATGRDVVNMGVSRLFGLRYCLEEVKETVQPGDTIVIVPEYENFYGEMNGSAHLMNVPLLLPRASKWVWQSYATSPDRLKALATDVSGVLTFKWNWWKKHALAFIEHPQVPVSLAGCVNPAEPEHFVRENFTTSGDFIGHLNATPPENKYFKLCDGLGNKIDPEAALVLNQFNDFARGRGADVLLLPAPLPRGVYKHNKARVDAVYDFCLHHLNFPVLAPPDRYTFANRNFFNSLYHLNADARTERTELVLQDLESHAQTAATVKPGSMGL